MSNCRAIVQDVGGVCLSQSADPVQILVMHLPAVLASCSNTSHLHRPTLCENDSGTKHRGTSVSCRRRCGELVVQSVAPPTIGLHLGLATLPNSMPPDPYHTR